MATRLRSLADAVAAVASRSLPDLPRVEPPAPDLGPAVPLDEITFDKILVNRERAAVRARADAFGDFLRINSDADGIPFDEFLLHIEYWRALVESFGIAYLRWPDAFPEPAIEEDETLAGYAPMTESEAYANGLAVAKCRPKRLRIAATLAGCQGKMSDSSDCTNLRRKGERFCPAHRAAMIRHLRGM